MAKSFKKIVSLFMCFLMVLSCLNGYVFEGIGNIVAKALDTTPVAGDINGDGNVNNKDLTRLLKHIKGEDVEVVSVVTDANGDGEINEDDLDHLMNHMAGAPVKIYPVGCVHQMTFNKAVESTCVQEGNIEYWQCSLCEKLFSDEEGITEITLADTIAELKGHTVVIDPAKEPTKTETGLTEGSHCSVCNKILVPQEVLPIINGYSITYNIATGSSSAYIAGQGLDLTIPDEKRQYASSNGLAELPELTLDGYQFLGWYTAPPENTNAVQVNKIDAGSTGNYTLYAHWYEYTYDITYKLYQTPLAPITTEKHLHYTVSKGLVDLPNPELYNYVFLGWYTDDGNEVKDIPVGTTGDITLNAYWTSKRNLAKAVNDLQSPIICEDINNGVYYFAYELGTIENIPLTDAIWTIQSVAGLSQQKSETISKTTSSTQANEIAESINKATVDSATWTLSENWNDSVTVNEQWAEQNGMTVEEAEAKSKTSSNTFSISSSEGGSDTFTRTDGITTLNYGSISATKEVGSHFDVNVDTKYSNSTELSVGLTAGLSAGISKIPLDVGEGSLGGTLGGSLGAKNTSTFEIGLGAEYGVDQKSTVNLNTGTEETVVETNVNSNTSSWNNSATKSSTESVSVNSSVSKALSQVISNTKNYGSSHSYGGSGSETQGLSTSTSESVNSASTLSYSTSVMTETTTTYSTDGKSDGCYRLVIAGTAHVFGVVGYDVASKSFFTYTYSVMDDKTYEFLDYSPTLAFDDAEYSVLPFEIPYDVYGYVASKITQTSGLAFRTDTANGTATLVRYDGSDTDVTIPSYITSGNVAYKVTGISATAFAGKDVRAVVLGDHIAELPAGAFKNCTKLEDVTGYFTKIGAEAFSGCVALNKYTISSGITEIGADAFADVNALSVDVIDSRVALQEAKKLNPDAEEGSEVLTETARTITQNLVDSAVKSGAKNITLDLSSIAENTPLAIDVPEVDSFELRGGLKTYNELTLSSDTTVTSIKEITVHNTSGVPFEISSDTVNLDAVKAESAGFVLLLSKNNPTVSLTRDSRLTSIDKKAVVWCNPTIDSVVFESAVGTLDISGDVYTCGTINGIDYLTVTDGIIKYISEDEFDKYIQGVYSITFDVNGGFAEEVSPKEVFYGSPLGELPVPTRDYYTFDGWYTADDTLVTAETVLTEAKDIELIAHWTENAVSDWILESDLPEDAQVVDTKWTYDHKITSSYSSVDGYTLYDTTSAWSEYGEWSGWSKTQAYSSDSREIETKTVTDSAAYTRYRYWGYTNGSWRHFCSKQGAAYHGGSWREYSTGWITTNISGSASGQKHSYSNCSCGLGYLQEPYVYNYNNVSYYHKASEYIPAVTHTEYRYRDRSLIYTYYFVSETPLESETEITESENMTNVNKWVQYRAK